MKKYALLHIYLPQFAMSASLPLLSEHSTRSAPRNHSCFIIFPCPYCFLIVFDIYLIIFCYILLLHLTRYQSEPHKRQVLCRGFSPKTSLPPYRCGWRSLCPGWKGTFARHFRQGVRVFWLIVFPIFSLTDQVIETI